MTNEQTEALNRVRASMACARNTDYASASYRTDDMEQVLDLLDKRGQALMAAKEDFKDMAAYLTPYDEACDMATSAILAIDSYDSL